MMNAPGRPANPLSGPSIAETMVGRLDPSSAPQFKTPLHVVALAIDAGMENVGFRLKGLGEDHNLESDPSFKELRPLPADWNSPTTTVSFRYSHPQSSMQFLVNVSRLGPTVEVSGMVLDGKDYHKSANFTLKIEDYISQSSLPATPRGEDTSKENAQKAIIDILISPARLSDLGSLTQVSLIQKLAPSISKEGYEETHASQESSTQSAERAPPRARDDPRPTQPAFNPPQIDPLAEPRRPRPVPTGEFPPPGFEDEYDMYRQPGRLPGMGPHHPLNIGEQDLYPPGLGPHDPIRPHFGPPGGFGGPGMGGMGGGMHPTFDDPLFAGGRPGGGGRNPQVPPGARYDPTGPGGMPGRGPRGGFPGAGGPPNPFAGFGDGDFL